MLYQDGSIGPALILAGILLVLMLFLQAIIMWVIHEIIDYIKFKIKGGARHRRRVE